MPTWPDAADDVLGTCLDTFGVPCTYTPSGGSPAELPSGGVFKRPGTVVEGLGEAGIASTEPTLGVRLSELPASWTTGDTVDVDGEGTFRVVGVDEDGENGARIRLQELDS